MNNIVSSSWKGIQVIELYNCFISTLWLFYPGHEKGSRGMTDIIVLSSSGEQIPINDRLQMSESIMLSQSPGGSFGIQLDIFS